MAATALIRQLVNLHRAQLAGLVDVRAAGRLKKLYAEARVELARKLRRLQVAGEGESFTAAHLRAVMAQVAATLKDFEGPFREHMEQTGQVAANVGARQVASMVGQVETHLGRMTPVIQAAQVAVVRGVYPNLAPTLLDKFRSSSKLFGPQAMVAIRGGLAQSMIQGETVDEAVDRLVDANPLKGIFEGQRWRAERIVRTETAYSAHAARQRSMEQMRPAVPKLLKRWVETFDSRTGEDSKELNGQTVPVDQPFTWIVKDAHGIPTGKIVHMMHGPNRPNDRSVQIPWQAAWGAPPAEPGPVEPTTRGVPTA